MSVITTMQAVELIQDHMKEIEPFRIVFAFKRMKLKPIRKTTVDLMRTCIAIHDYGLPITMDLVSAVYSDGIYRGTSLHTLGDKKCLLLKRSDIKRGGHLLEWTIDPLFLEHYK